MHVSLSASCFIFVVFLVNDEMGRYGRYRPSRPDFGRVGADFGRIGAELSRVGPRRAESVNATWRDAARRGTDARSAASLPRRRVPPRRTRVRAPGSRVRASQVLKSKGAKSKGSGFAGEVEGCDLGAIRSRSRTAKSKGEIRSRSRRALGSGCDLSGRSLAGRRGAAVTHAELAVEAGLPSGVLNILHGSNEIVNAICDDDVKAISFAGLNVAGNLDIDVGHTIGLLLQIVYQLLIYCSKAGTYVYARASAKGKHIQSNVGAKNHAVVMPDASMDATSNALVAAGFGAAGQKGAHPRPTRRDAATREGRRRPRVRAASCRVPPRGIYRFGPTRADAAQFGADTAEIGADAAEIGPTRPVSAVSACSDLVIMVVWWRILWQVAQVATRDGGGIGGGGSIDCGGDGIGISNGSGNDVKSNGGLFKIIMVGCPRVEPGRFSTQLEPDLQASGGQKSDPKLTAGVDRSSWFWVWVEIGSVRVEIRSSSELQNHRRSCKSSLESANHRRKIENAKTPYQNRNQLLKSMRDHCKSRTIKNLDHALGLFDTMLHMHPLPSIVDFNHMFGSIARMKHYSVVITLIQRMESFGISPDVYTLNVLVNCYCHLNLVNFGNISGVVRLVEEMENKGYQPNAITCGTIINSMCKNGQTGVAIKLLKKLEKGNSELNVVLYSMVINSLCKDRLVTEDLNLLSEMMSKGIQPNIVTYNSLVQGLCNFGRWREAKEVFDVMIQRGIDPNIVTYNSLVQGLCNFGRWREATTLLNEMGQRKVMPNVRTFSILVDTLCKEGMLTEAKEVFDVMIQRGIDPNIVTYNSLVQGLCNFGQWREATTLLNEMGQRKVMPDVQTFSILVDTLCKEGMLIEAKEVFDVMIQKGIDPNIVTYNSFIDGYCLQNKLDEAVKTFNMMVEKGCSPNVVSYNILINGYCKSKKIDEAKRLFHEMSNKGMIPNVVTYNTLIGGLCRVERVQTTLELFNTISLAARLSSIPLSLTQSHFLTHSLTNLNLTHSQSHLRLTTQPLTAGPTLAVVPSSVSVTVHRRSQFVLLGFITMSPFKKSAVKGGSSKGKELVIDVDNLSPRTTLKTHRYWLKKTVDRASLIETKIPKWFATKDWNYLLSNLDDAYENMVKEFYANAIFEGDELKCWVRGKSFKVTLVYLADILRINRPMFPKPPLYDDLNSEEEVLQEALGDNLEFSSNGKSINVASLSPELRLLTTIMFHNLYPLSSTGYMNLGRALFLHDLIIDEEIDVCSHIFHILTKIVERTASRKYLPFCRLILKILKLKGVHPLEDEYPYPQPSQINIHTLNANIGHTRKSTKHESHAPQGSSSSSSHTYDEKLDNIMATL
uniref:Uncharacterized protein n=1 Tax=Quercus lobata TaxID=97700 RepID=A0A7N2R348_QUELO